MTQIDSFRLFLNATRRRKVFLSYHHDADQVFYDRFSKQFHDEYECITDNSIDRLIDSDSPEYVIQRIRDEYISGSSCTIVLCGPETPYRKYVDWEIKATLDRRHGSIGIGLPTAKRGVFGRVIVPDRLHDNVQSGYAVWLSWENLSLGPVLLKLSIALATLKSVSLIVNKKEIMKKNASAPNDLVGLGQLIFSRGR